MKHVLLVLACLVIPSLALSASADSTSARAERLNSLRAGAWALEFSFTGNFDGSELTGKRHLTPETAIRLGLSFSTGSRTEEFATDTTLTIRSQESDTDNVSTRVELVLQHYPNISLPAQFYFGVGPFVSYYRRQETGTQWNADPDYGERYDYVRDDTSWSGGATLLIGAEWFASRALSLFTEYNGDGGYRKATSERTTDVVGATSPVYDTTEFSEWFFQTGSARFGVGFYF